MTKHRAENVELKTAITGLVAAARDIHKSRRSTFILIMVRRLITEWREVDDSRRMET